MSNLLYTISSNKSILWSVKGNTRILQNIINLLNTNIYEVAYMRTMGLSRKFIDCPANAHQGLITSEVMDLISKFEPRAKVKSVIFNGITQDGDIIVEVVVDI
jgi:phage baseplate assembly protein W